ncbi:hypothetical protein ACHAW5_008239 [Stephanodiscus triporus]|uniref:Cyclin-like domain-containing protein n=1 Tax=Stephanodiscus triporus TaxID=2934178 RepID=A0ABD3NCK7_9STRA
MTKTINDKRADILGRLDAMLVQEATASTRCFDYFKNLSKSGAVDETSRRAMVTWLRQVQVALSLSPDTVWIATSILDRYLCSGKGGSSLALEDRVKFQLAAITAFYTAVKIHEPVVLGIDMLLVVCRNAYAERDFVSMEMDVLSAIGWRVSCHTAMDYARALLELIVEDERLPSGVAEGLLGDCERRMGDAIADVRSSSCRERSELGMRCVAMSLDENASLSDSEKGGIWIRLSESCVVDRTMMVGGCDASRRYLHRATYPCEPKNAVSKSRTSSRRQPAEAVSKYGTAGSSSPICISCTARQA